MPVKVGGDSRVSAGIHGNSASSNHPSDTVTMAKSVEILTKSTNEGGKGRDKEQNRCMVWRTKQTAQPHMAGTHNMCNSRSLPCMSPRGA